MTITELRHELKKQGYSIIKYGAIMNGKQVYIVYDRNNYHFMKGTISDIQNEFGLL